MQEQSKTLSIRPSLEKRYLSNSHGILQFIVDGKIQAGNTELLKLVPANDIEINIGIAHKHTGK